MSILKGQLETDNGDALFPKTSADMVEGINAKQLLLNSDFQVNQRGLNIYDYTNKGGITIDMWLVNQMKVSVMGDNWVRVENPREASHFFQQKFGFTRKGPHTVSLNVRNIEGIVSLYYEKEDHGGGTVKVGDLKNGRNEFTFTASTMKNIAINVPTNSSVEIEYIDLFEGNIANQHTKADYETELAICQKRYIKLRETATILYRYSDTKVLYNVPFPKMYNNPKLVSIKINATDDFGNGMEATYSNLTDLYVEDKSSMSFKITWPKAVKKDIGGSKCLIELSCELV